jgi:hypothetical protein
LLAALAAYLLLALPLPFILLDHELGLLAGDPTHTALDDHAWLDHAAGAGIASSDTATPLVDLVVSLVPAGVLSHESVRTYAPSVRGPPACLS